MRVTKQSVASFPGFPSPFCFNFACVNIMHIKLKERERLRPPVAMNSYLHMAGKATGGRGSVPGSLFLQFLMHTIAWAKFKGRERESLGARPSKASLTCSHSSQLLGRKSLLLHRPSLTLDTCTEGLVCVCVCLSVTSLHADKQGRIQDLR